MFGLVPSVQVSFNFVQVWPQDAWLLEPWEPVRAGVCRSWTQDSQKGVGNFNAETPRNAEMNGKRGKILTTDYTDFTDRPRAERWGQKNGDLPWENAGRGGELLIGWRTAACARTERVAIPGPNGSRTEIQRTLGLL